MSEPAERYTAGQLWTRAAVAMTSFVVVVTAVVTATIIHDNSLGNPCDNPSSCSLENDYNYQMIDQNAQPLTQQGSNWLMCQPGDPPFLYYSESGDPLSIPGLHWPAGTKEISLRPDFTESPSSC